MKYCKLYSLILIPNIARLVNLGHFPVEDKVGSDSSSSPYQKHCLCGRILVLSSHDSKGGNNELIKYRKEPSELYLDLPPDNILPEPVDLKGCLHFEQFFLVLLLLLK